MGRKGGWSSHLWLLQRVYHFEEVASFLLYLVMRDVYGPIEAHKGPQFQFDGVQSDLQATYINNQMP